MAKRAFLLLALSGLSRAIYPDDHWDYSKQLTEDNFHDFVNDEIESGRTLFVRWIASSGWGWWRKQAPAWNRVVKAFKGNDDVSFGDVNLQEQPIRDYSPGAGGWPTIRYFNADTGPEGAPYDKKTDKAMCDELGDDEYMTAYVEEAGKTSLCALSGNGCDERQIKYIEKMKEKEDDEIKRQFDRLEGMKDKSMAPDLLQWVQKRKKILKQFIQQKDAKKEL